MSRCRRTTTAVARLVHAIESAERRAFLTADAGLGKSTVLRRAFDRGPRPRTAIRALELPARRDTAGRHAGRAPGANASAASRAGSRRGGRSNGPSGWRRSRACTSSSESTTAKPQTPMSAATSSRSANLAPGSSARITVIQAGRPRPQSATGSRRTMDAAITLESLTRTQAEAFLTTKLKSAGRDEPVFTARAVTRLHCLSAGVPRLIEQLATLCLMTAQPAGSRSFRPSSSTPSKNRRTTRSDCGGRTTDDRRRAPARGRFKRARS